MKIITISPIGFGANTYILTADNKNAVVIDPSQPRIKEALLQRGLKAAHVLLTHCHFDHVSGIAALQADGAEVVCSAEEAKLVGTEADAFDLAGIPRVEYTVDKTLKDGETVNLSGIEIKTILTPGHTAGCACYLVKTDDGEVLFTGDTLFAGSIGRTDLPTGSLKTLRQSLKKLAALTVDYPVYPGHEESTTLFTEKKRNPFLRGV
ncbi:MAG: MBL fold metallo-hydrolase [Clostridia bacterium]|nr:MBL fold metallo-hydrolase [Clostridia bacterium]